MPDPRTTEGELMCPALYPPERIVKRKRDSAARLHGAVSAATSDGDGRSFSSSVVASAGGSARG